MRKMTLIFIFAICLFVPFIGFCDDAVVLKYTTKIDVSSEKCIQTENVIIQVNNAKGDKYVDFVIDYSSNAKLKNLTGELRDIHSTVIRKLKKSDIKTTSKFDHFLFYNDNLAKRFSLKHNVYPYIVEVEFEHVISPYIYVAKWFPVWNTEINTQKAVLSVTVPEDYKLKINQVAVDSPSKQVAEKGVTYIWSSSYTSSNSEDIFATPLVDILPLVSVVPQNFYYIKPGSFDSWKAMGEWNLELDKGLDELPSEEKMTIDHLTDGIEDSRQIVRELYHYLQDNTRYVAVNIDLGGLEPYPASYVCENRFGDCKALTNYMKAMLSYKGIPSYKVFVRAGETPEKIHTDFPSHQANHVILAVPLANDTIWMECTASYLPFNYLGTFTQNRPVFLVEPNRSRIIHSPALTEEEVTSVLSYRFTINENDPKVRLSALFKLRGEAFEYFKGQSGSWTEKEKHNAFNELIPFKNYKVDEYEVMPVHRDSSFFILETTGTCNSPYQTVGEFVKVDLPSMNLPVFEKVKDRELPLDFYVPLAQIDTLFFDVPYDVLELKTPDNQAFEDEFGNFEMKIVQTSGQLCIVRKYNIYRQKISLEKYSNFYDFITEMKSSGSSIIFKPLK